MSEDDAPLPASNPWRTLASRQVYSNAWIRVREDQVLRPNGRPGIYGVVEMKIATGVVALTPDRNVVMVGQWRYPFESYSWEIVEGAAEDGEPPQQAAARELQEEAGLVAETWRPLGRPLCLSNSVTNEVAHLFWAEGLSPVTTTPDETELLKIRNVPLAEAVAQAESGEIVDAMSVVALLRLDRLLGRGSV